MPAQSLSSEDLSAMAGGWWIATLVGVMSVTAGILVIAKPSNSVATLAVISGIFVLIDGIVAILESLVRDTESRGVVAILGVVSVVVGILLIRHPVAGVKGVALLLGIWLIAAAMVRLVVAIGVSEHRLRRLAGAAVLAIAGIAIVSSPQIGYATLALIAGLGFIGYGASMIVVGWAIRTVGHSVAQPGPRGAVTT
jgi:uncharacterized membrane protein HdeD (DUF308 family)